MLEPEIAFAGVNEAIELAEHYLKFVINYLLRTIPEDLEFFDQKVKKGQLEYLKQIVENEFKRITYKQAMDLLISHVNEQKVEFQINPNDGSDLSSEHEKYICHHF